MAEEELPPGSSSLAEAAEALFDLAQRREFLEPPFRGELSRWQGRTGDSIEEIVAGQGDHSLGERRRASFRLSLLPAQEALDSETVEPLRRSVVALAGGLF